MENKKIENKNNKNIYSHKKRKPYQRPEIISEKTFETAALACSKCDIFGPDESCPWGTPGAS